MEHCINVQFMLSKSELQILKKMLKKSLDNFRIVGDSINKTIHIYMAIKESIQSKISKEWTSIETWFDLPLKTDYLANDFKIQGTHESFKNTFLLWIQQYPEFWLELNYSNDSDFDKRVGIRQQLLVFTPIKSKDNRVEFNFRAQDRSNPFSEMNPINIFTKSEENHYLIPSDQYIDLNTQLKPLPDKQSIVESEAI